MAVGGGFNQLRRNGIPVLRLALGGPQKVPVRQFANLFGIDVSRVVLTIGLGEGDGFRCLKFAFVICLETVRANRSVLVFVVGDGDVPVTGLVDAAETADGGVGVLRAEVEPAEILGAMILLARLILLAEEIRRQGRQR